MKKFSIFCCLLAVFCTMSFSGAWANTASDIESRIVALKEQARPLRAQGLETNELDRQINDLYTQWLTLQPQREIRTTLDQGADVCPGTPIFSLPYSDSGSTANATSDYSGCAGNSSPDVVYALNLNICAIVTVSLCGSGYDTGLEIRTGGACPGTSTLRCNDDFCGVSSQVSFQATPGVTYYIIVHGFAGDFGRYFLNVTGEPCPVGRCCYLDDGEQACEYGVTADYCADLMGIFQANATCTSAPCPEIGDCGPMDLVFVIDVTGSMQPSIDNVKAELPNIVGAAYAASNGDLRLGLVTFRDNVHTEHNLTGTLAPVMASINALIANGGASLPEASDEALREVITMDALCTDGTEFTSPFRVGASKIIVLVTDADAGGCDDVYTAGVDDANAHLRALAASALGIRISSVFVPTFGDPNGTIVPVLQDYAFTTSGSYQQVAANGVGTADAINSIIEDCGQGEVVLDDIVPELHCINGEIHPNPAELTVVVSNTGTASCGEAILLLSNGAGPGGTATVASTNPVHIASLDENDVINVAFDVIVTPSDSGGCIYFTAVLTSRDCPRAFLEFCLYVPRCIDCQFPFDGVDLGDLMRCNYPTLARNPGHGLSGIAWLGDRVTAENIPNIFNQDPADDGVEFIDLPWHPCQDEWVRVVVTAGQNYGRYLECGGQLYLNAWKDGNIDGDFCDELCNETVSEWIIQDMVVTPGSHTIQVMDPGVFDLNQYDGIFRFRLTSQPVGRYGFGLSDMTVCPRCACGDFDFDFLGEVEDYYIVDAQLDVELADFDVEAGSNGIVLNWSTASETNNDRFEIERDGAIVGTVDSRGNTTTGNNYSWTDNNVQGGVVYDYALVQVDIDGNRHVLANRTASSPLSSPVVINEYALQQNYPNPFNPVTNITFDIADKGSVSLKVFDVMGHEVANLVSGELAQGRHTVAWDARNLPAGMYLCRLEAGSFTATRKMMLIK